MDKKINPFDKQDRWLFWTCVVIAIVMGLSFLSKFIS
jgi:hypothetical protein